MIDPAIPAISVAALAAIVALVTVVFNFKTASLAKRVEEHDVKIAEVIKTSDGMKTELVAMTAKASFAEGQLAGSESAENKSNAATAAKATGAADAASQAHKE